MVEFIAGQVRYMRDGEGAEDEVHFPHAPMGRTEDKFFSAGIEFVLPFHSFAYAAGPMESAAYSPERMKCQPCKRCGMN